MRETHRPGSQRYFPGDYWTTCDTCGFHYLRSDLIKDDDNFLVCTKCFDTDLDEKDNNTHDRTNTITGAYVWLIDENNNRIVDENNNMIYGGTASLTQADTED